MSTFDRVKNSKSPQDALAAIAHGIDHICARLDKLEGKDNDGWGEWEGSDAAADAEDESERVERLEAANRRIRAIKDKLEGADDDDRRALEADLRLAQDELRELGAIEAGPPPTASVVEVVDGEVVVNLPIPDEKRKRLRRELAEYIQLEDSIEGISNEHYVEGGPLWLYYGNREYVVSLPTAVHQRMVADVFEDDPIEAAQMSADLLKHTEPEGPETVLGRLHGDD